MGHRADSPSRCSSASARSIDSSQPVDRRPVLAQSVQHDGVKVDLRDAALLHALSQDVFAGSRLALVGVMLKFLGAYALAKLLGFGLITALLIYMFIR